MFITSAKVLYSAEIKSISINPLNRAIIQFDTLPDNINSHLSDNKTLIKIELDAVRYDEKLSQISGLGIISDVYLRNENGKTIVNIKTKDKRGYTVSKRAFTDRIFIDVFQWDMLSIEEENFRMGLLAYEDKILNEALRNFYQAAKNGVYESVFNLGNCYFETGYTYEAYKSYEFAYNFDSTNIDALAGLAVSLSKLGMNNESKYFSELFKMQTGKDVSAVFSVSETLLDSNLLDLSFLNKINFDSLNITTKDSITVLDSTFSDIEISLQDSTSHSEQSNSLFSDIKEYIYYALVIVGGTFIALIFYYFKWRRTQIESRSSKPVEKFEDKLKEATAKVNPNILNNKYSSVSVNTKSDNKENENSNPENQSGVINDYKINKLGDVIESITGKPAESYKKSESQSNVNAKLQLAMHLAEEQRRIKTQNIESLNSTSIPNDKKKLSEISKKLGIEKGGLETKLAMEKLMKDKNLLKKLSEKFGL
ncbi:MAG: hypothetical protein KIT33_00890 [Candidatus Kapabacteria bacterium]|nr:hypothetical protein [Ignavibacteriota bacterium]MCW5883503.1 hypothetical protein [Candidatus Kapabacteria bacterium]